MMNLEDNDRFPLIPLSYKQRHLAKRGELIVDNENGRIYIVSIKDRSEIIDVTQQIINLISTDMTADNMIIEVEGQGRVNLKEYISYLRANMLKINNFSGKKCMASYGYDFMSITNKDNIIQLNNFWKARPGDIAAVDKFGSLVWTTPDGATPIVEATLDENDNVVLTERFSYTTLVNGAVIKLPKTQDSENVHATIFWKAESNAVEPILYIHDDCKVYLEYGNDIEMNPNAINIYRFETWDGGETWFESVKKYKKAENTFNEKIDLDYITNNYYTKTEVNDLLQWKNNNGTSLGS